MNLYTVDYWVPFPTSEYGGLYIIAAENEEEVKNQCILHTCSFDLKNCDFDNLNIQKIGNTEEYAEACVVRGFVT